jgi:hypothetical protein
VEKTSPALKEPIMGMSNRKLEGVLRIAFSPSRESICGQCSLRPSFCLGSRAEWLRCRYAMRIKGDNVLLPSDVLVSTEKKEFRAKPNGMENLIAKTIHRLHLLTSAVQIRAS